jgi:hypothetical protein
MTWQASKARLYIAQNLSFIEEVYTRLRAEAYFHASDHEIPGGDALVMLGPRADVEAWNYVKLSAIMGRLRLGHADATRHQLMIELEAIERDNHEIEPPLSFLAGWVDIIREARGQEPSSARATIAHEIAYLRDALDWIVATDETTGAPWWLPAESFAQDLYRVRLALEDVLKEGERPDTGAPCLNDRCDGVRLVKQWADAGLPAKFDSWLCPRCKRRYTGDEYSNACKQAGRLYADRLCASDMRETYRVEPSTLRTWASRGKVRKRGRDDSGRILYDVEDTLKARDVFAEGDSA